MSACSIIRGGGVVLHSSMRFLPTLLRSGKLQHPRAITRLSLISQRGEG